MKVKKKTQMVEVLSNFTTYARYKINIQKSVAFLYTLTIKNSN